MKGLLLLSAVGLAAYPSAAERRRIKLMQLVENRVQLPKGAERLERYARYYAKNGDHIIAIYTTFSKPTERDFDLPVGHQRWLDDYRNLPAVLDGGCSTVKVLYDLKGRTAPEAFCNGEA